MENTKEFMSLEEIQEAELALLIRLDKFLKDNQISYSLMSGTLLGAVRHKGFIPWDDDIDICMSRGEYERFLSIADKLPQGLRCLSYSAGGSYEQPFAKVVDESIIAHEQGYSDEHTTNLWVDIFPMDGFPADQKEANDFYKKLDVLRHKYYWLTLDPKYSSKNFLAYAIKSIYRLFNESRLDEVRNNFFQEIEKYPYETSVMISSPASTMLKCWSIDKAGFERYTTLPFCGHDFMVMGNYKECLEAIYGDYMQLPPEDKRVTHSVVAWRKQ